MFELWDDASESLASWASGSRAKYRCRTFAAYASMSITKMDLLSMKVVQSMISRHQVRISFCCVESLLHYSSITQDGKKVSDFKRASHIPTLSAPTYKIYLSDKTLNLAAASQRSTFPYNFLACLASSYISLYQGLDRRLIIRLPIIATPPQLADTSFQAQHSRNTISWLRTVISSRTEIPSDLGKTPPGKRLLDISASQSTWTCFSLSRIACTGLCRKLEGEENLLHWHWVRGSGLQSILPALAKGRVKSVERMDR